MNPDFYASTLGLSLEERKEFEGLCGEDEFLEMLVMECASGWRLKRDTGIDPVSVRRLYLVRSILAAARIGILTKSSRAVSAAFAFEICDRIERRVWELDRAEEARK